jgi:hypothetical protein
LSIDLASAEGGVLHFGRKRMCDWIAKNAEPNRGGDVVCDLIPPLKVSECVPLGSLSVFHYSDIEDTTVILECEYAASG